jgi:hypothetical protein
VDAGWDFLTKRAGFGIIIRNHLGRPLFSEWRYVPSCTSAEEAEVLASLERLKCLSLHFVVQLCWNLIARVSYIHLMVQVEIALIAGVCIVKRRRS